MLWVTYSVNNPCLQSSEVYRYTSSDVGLGLYFYVWNAPRSHGLCITYLLVVLGVPVKFTADTKGVQVTLPMFPPTANLQWAWTLKIQLQ